jgi:DNA replication and repair protein RecF
LKGSHNLEVRIILQPNQDRYKPRVRKEILLDGVKCKTSESIGAFNAVLFLPHMMRIVEGPPEERRRYLNLLMVQTIPHYARVLTDYNRSLVQRNALLKQLAERGGDKNQLDYWDEQLASSGAQIIFQRIHTVQALERLASNVHNELTRSKEVLRLDYTPSFDPIPNKPGQYNLPLDAPVDRTWLTLENIQMGFVERLEKLRNEEIIRGVTTIGPHRDEIRLLSNGIDLGNFGSRGQGRTAVMALKLARTSNRS